jgi:hypothetical protein
MPNEVTHARSAHERSPTKVGLNIMLRVCVFLLSVAAVILLGLAVLLLFGWTVTRLAGA